MHIKSFSIIIWPGIMCHNEAELLFFSVYAMYIHFIIILLSNKYYQQHSVLLRLYFLFANRMRSMMYICIPFLYFYFSFSNNKNHTNHSITCSSMLASYDHLISKDDFLFVVLIVEFIDFANICKRINSSLTRLRFMYFDNSIIVS